MPRSRETIALFALAAAALAMPGLPLAETTAIGRWSFDGAAAGANGVAGGPAARIERASVVEGRSGKALAFEDWSVRDYLKPDPRGATRAVVPADPKLAPPLPFRLSAWIYPTADPVYYGGIAEMGRGFGAAYRLVLLRGLRVQASVGERHVSAKSTAPISLNEWHEVTLAAGPSELVLMVDGKEAGRASLPAGLKAGAAGPLVIGERFTGKIDEISLTAE